MEKIIEIKGVKFNAKMSEAQEIKTLTIGSPVKVLTKEYERYSVYPGVVIGFTHFDELPTIEIAYLKTDYASAEIKFLAYNSKTTGVEIVPVSPMEIEIPFIQENAITMLDEAIRGAEIELHNLRRKREFFMQHLGKFCWDKKERQEGGSNE